MIDCTKFIALRRDLNKIRTIKCSIRIDVHIEDTAEPVINWDITNDFNVLGTDDYKAESPHPHSFDEMVQDMNNQAVEEYRFWKESHTEDGYFCEGCWNTSSRMRQVLLVLSRYKP